MQEVFERLKPEYASRGWVVEYVDLRWGISPESTGDNRTIQICLEELRRCQEVSPRPNFIILSGERRGWIPVPEVIDTPSFEWLRKKCKEKDFLLIQRWYEGDYNSYPTPMFILRPKNYYGDATTFDLEVPLLEEIFRKVGYKGFGLSATELEIRNGILTDKPDNVMGYIRTLSNIPREYKPLYTSDSLSDWWEVKQVHRHLKNAIEPSNLITHKISFDELESTPYHDRLSQEFEQCVRGLIDKEIACNTSSSTLNDERQYHETFAREESARLIGREDEIARIRNLVESGEKISRLWYAGPSGVGKSALLARAAAMYLDNENYNVITVFCGLTPQTSTVQGMLGYLFHRLIEIIGSKKLDIDVHSPDYDWKLRSIGNHLITASSKRPLVVIIDSLDRLDYGNTEKTDILNIFDVTINPKAKGYIESHGLTVIFSTIDSQEWCNNNVIKNLTYTPICGLEHRESFVEQMLKSHGRSLTPLQSRYADKAAKDSDGRAVYLSLLVKCCAQLRSGDTPEEFPVEFEPLMYQYLDDIIDLRHYDRRLVHMSLALIACSKGGLRHDDMSHLLAMDSKVWSRFLQEAAHSFVTQESHSKRLPPIVWTRLYYDLSPILRPINSPSIGETFDFLHPTITQAILGYVGEETRTEAVKYLCEYFGQLWRHEDPLALDRIIAVTLERQDLPSQTRGRDASDIFMDPDFFIPRFFTREGALDLDSQLIAETIWPTFGVTEISTELQNMYPKDKTELIQRICNLPDSAQSKQLYAGSNGTPHNLLSNALRNDTLSTTILAQPGRWEQPSLSPTGLMGLRACGTELWHYDEMYGRHMVFDAGWIEPHTPARRQGKYQAYCTSLNGMGHEVILSLWETGDIVVRYSGLHEPPQWMEFSSSEKYFFFGSENFGTVRIDLTTLKIVTNPYFKFKKTYISNINDILWAQGKYDLDKGLETLHRFDTRVNFKEQSEWETYKIPANHGSSIRFMFIDDFEKLLYLFFHDGGCATFYLSEDKGNLLETGEVRYTYAVDAVEYGSVSYDFPTPSGITVSTRSGITRAYSSDRGCIFDFHKQWNMVAKDADGFSAANALNTDNTGDKLCLSYGKRNRAYAMKQVFLHTISPSPKPGEQPTYFNRRYPTFEISTTAKRLPIDIDLIYNSAISPDGKFLAFSTMGGKGLHPDQPAMGLLDINNPRGWRAWTTPNSARDIRFTADGRYAVLFGGHWCIYNKITLHVISRELELVYEKVHDIRTDSTYLASGISISGRYAVIAVANKAATDEHILLIHDLLNGTDRSIDIAPLMKDVEDNPLSSPHVSIVMSTVDESIYLGYGTRLNKIDPESGVITTVARFTHNTEAKRMSQDGRRIWLVDHKGQLLLVNIDTLTSKIVATDVDDVYECADCMHLFIIGSRDSQPNIQVRFTDLAGNVKEYAYLNSVAMRSTITDRGLVISDFDNDLSYYVPSPSHGMNSTVVAKVTERVDIEKGCMRQASVVCPACAREFIPSEGPGLYECPSCHRPIRVI